MVKDDGNAQADETIDIDLRNPALAAFLGWLIPGLGHLYQRRYAKGVLFMVVILATFFGGLWIGKGRVVYASWTKTDKRWQYFCQVGVGLPALPALIQANRVFDGQADGRVNDDPPALNDSGEPAEPSFFETFMAPPEQPVYLDFNDNLAEWHEDLGYRFELGTLYTMVAGLLNVLAICDAYAGPFTPKPEDDEPSSDEDNG